MAINLAQDSILELNKRFVINRDTIEINTTEAFNTVAFTKKYDAVGSAGFSKARNSDNLVDEVTIAKDKAENRISKITDRVGIFLYNLFPYQTLSAVNSIGSIAGSPNPIGLATDTGTSILSGLSKLKYLTPAELALTLGHNFYTLQFFRGITIKKGRKQKIGSLASNDDIWSGQTDLFFGRALNLSSTGIVSRFYTGVKDVAESSNESLASLKREITPKITVGSNGITIIKKQSSVDQLNSDNVMETEERYDLFHSVLEDQINNINGGWKAKYSEITNLATTTRQQMRGKGEDVNSLNHYKINTNVDIIIQRVNEFADNSWKKQTEDVSTENFSISNAENRKFKSNELKVNTDVDIISQRVNRLKNTKWIPLRDQPNDGKEEFSYKDALFRRGDSIIRDNPINKDAYNIELKINPKGDSGEGNLMKGSPEDLLRNKTFINNSEGKWQIGAILVIPVVSETYKNDLPRFFIPFEFNPEINENGIGARYQQTEILSRIGNLQSYTGTNSFSLSLSSKYFAVAHEGSSPDSTGNNWMSKFTLEKVQAIEMGYRSLVYPHYPDAEEENMGYKYVKPPLVKIIIGNHTDDTAPYANLLTYQHPDVVSNRLNTSINYGGKILRTFIVSEVTIKKDLNTTPLYLDENRSIRDTFGFEVSLNLMEVAPNYMDSMPDFKNYQTQYGKSMGEYVLGDANSTNTSASNPSTNTGSQG